MNISLTQNGNVVNLTGMNSVDSMDFIRVALNFNPNIVLTLNGPALPQNAVSSVEDEHQAKKGTFGSPLGYPSMHDNSDTQYGIFFKGIPPNESQPGKPVEKLQAIRIMRLETGMDLDHGKRRIENPEIYCLGWRGREEAMSIVQAFRSFGYRAWYDNRIDAYHRNDD